MKHTSYYFFHTCLFLCVTLTACTAKRSAIKAVSESETASVTESRLTFYRTIDSLSRQFNMAADSIIMIFPNTSMTEFPTAYTSEMIGCTETPSDSSPAPRTPHKVKVYGLHLNENIEKKSVDNTDLKDSVNTSTQSKKHKSASKQKTATPSSISFTLILVSIILCIIIGVFLIHRIRKFSFI